MVAMNLFYIVNDAAVCGCFILDGSFWLLHVICYNIMLAMHLLFRMYKSGLTSAGPQIVYLTKYILNIYQYDAPLIFFTTRMNNIALI